MTDRQNPPNIQKAIDFFTKANLSRLLEKLRERYIELGRVGGQVLLENCTPKERQDIASFLGKPVYSEPRITVRLADIDKALGPECELPDLLNAFFPDRPLETRPQQRAARAIHQADFRAALVSMALELPEDSRGRFWLLHGQHGEEWLFSHYKNEPLVEQERQLNLARLVISALDQLPSLSSSHSFERLALFAQRISGDPHFFDLDRAAGRLFRHALDDLVNLSDKTPRHDHMQAPDLYANAGLLVDTISSNVAVFNLAGAVYHGGKHDPLPQAAGKRVLLLPLCQLLEWQSVQPAAPYIYTFENPQVFEEVIAGLIHSKDIKTLPTLVCTSGWPSAAALKLLDLLATADQEDHKGLPVIQSAATILYYSGDFDLAGLKIAISLMQRYPEQFHPWRYDPESYVNALHDKGTMANPSDLAALNSFPAAFAALVAIMQEKGKWAYQEGIAHLLMEDVSRRKSER